MTRSNPLQTTEHPPSDIQSQRKFWGVIAISVLAFLAYSYALSNLFGLEPTTAGYIKMAVYVIAIILAVTSFVLAIRQRVDFALTIIFYFLLITQVANPATTQGRTLNATFTMLVVGILMIGWLLPRSNRRKNAALLAGAFILAWVIEWINPPWRIVTGRNGIVGPAVAITFAVFLAALTAYQARKAVNRSLRLRITVWAGTILLLLSAVLVTYSSLSARQTAIQNGQDDALQHASTFAGTVRSEVSIPLDTARALAQSLSAVKDPYSGVTLTRQQVDGMLRQVLADNPGYLGTYTLWEPNAFDGLDSEFRNTERSDETGRFIPYWIRGEDGVISVTPLEQYETPGIGDWYVLPRQNKQEMTFAPLIYPINGVDTVMASFIVPVMYKGNFYGIAGVDAPIVFVQNLVDTVDLYNGTADAVLLTSSGTLIGVRNRPDLVNQPAEEIYPDFSDLQAKLEAGEAFISLSPDGNYLRAFAPVDLGNTGDHWAFGLVVPFAEITRSATTAALTQVGISAALIALALFLLWFLTGQVVNPLQKLTTVADAVTEGNLNRRAEVISEDEVGTLASAFNNMTSQLQETLEGLEERVRARTKDLATVARISTTTATIRDPFQMLATAVHLTQRGFNLYHAHVFTLNQKTDELEIVACGYKEGDEHEGTHGTAHIPVGREQSLVARAARTRKPVIVNDVQSDPGWLPNPMLPLTRAELAVPMIVGDEVLGVLDVQAEQVNAFTEEDANIQMTLAAQLATALQNARSYTTAKEQADFEALVNTISQKIQRSDTVEETLQTAVRELGTALGASRVKAVISAHQSNKNTN